MFTGIVRGIGKITEAHHIPGRMRLGVSMEKSLSANVETGASIAIDGVCLTVVSTDQNVVHFDVIQETLDRTTLRLLAPHHQVNIERSARLGDEIGGHLLSGHIYGTAKIFSIEKENNNCVVTLQCAPAWTKYLLPKGYIALNGASLTLVDVHKDTGLFTVHLIPETLQRTTFGTKKVGDIANVELDSQTQAIVDTIERIYANRSTN